MDLDQENLNFIEEAIEEINYDDLVEDELENENEEDHRMFLLDESAPNAAKTMFESLNLQCIQGDDVESDDESHMLIDSDEEEDLTIPDTLPTKLSPCIIVDNSKGEISRCCSTEKLVPIAQLFGTWEVDASVG